MGNAGGVHPTLGDVSEHWNKLNSQELQMSEIHGLTQSAHTSALSLLKKLFADLKKIRMCGLIYFSI